MFSIYLVSRFTRVFELTINIMIRAKRKAGRTTKKLLTLTLTCTPCFSWRQVRRLRIITLRKLSPWLSVLECKHAESTNNCREKQILHSIGEDAEQILNSYTHCKYKLLNGSRTTWQCILWAFIVGRKAPKDTGDSHARTSRIRKCAREEWE